VTAPAGVSGVTKEAVADAYFAWQMLNALCESEDTATTDRMKARDAAWWAYCALSALSLPSSEAGEPVAWQYRVSVEGKGWVDWQPWEREDRPVMIGRWTAEYRPLYTRPAASPAGLGDAKPVAWISEDGLRDLCDSSDTLIGIVGRMQTKLATIPLFLAPPLAAATDEGVHSCSSYCKRPGCIERQRDEYRERLAAATVGLTDEEREALELCEREIDDPVFNLTGRVRFKRVFAALRRVLATRPPQPGSEAWDTESRRLHREITMLRDERNALLAARPPAAAGADEQGES
jgi:hypothetical protein